MPAEPRVKEDPQGAGHLGHGLAATSDHFTGNLSPDSRPHGG